MTTEEIIASTRQVAEGAKSCSSILAARPQTAASTPRSPSTSTPSSRGEMSARDMMNAFIARDTKHERD